VEDRLKDKEDDNDDEEVITPDLAKSSSILLFTSSPTLINGGPIHLVTYLLAVNSTIYHTMCC
jgi:hypothetical protein